MTTKIISEVIWLVVALCSMRLGHGAIVHAVSLLEKDRLGKLRRGVLRSCKRRDVLRGKVTSMCRRKRRGSRQRREVRRQSLQHTRVGGAQVA